MKVTGYMLKEQIKIRMMELESLYARFENQILAFPGEERMPIEYAETLMDVETQVVKLQTAQKFYNLNALVTAPYGELDKVSLEYIIKLVGPVARIAKRWRKASQPDKDRYYGRENVRKADEVYEQRTISEDDCLTLAMELERKAAKMRSIIATANSVEMEIHWLDSSLFD